MEWKRFKCEVCDEGFVTSMSLLRHQRVHTREKPFRCEVCNKSFSNLSTLRVHQRVHTGEKPFTCFLCYKSFSVSSTLRRHQRIHTGEKPYTCEVCDKSFSDSSTLRQHKGTHTREKPFKCEVCDKSFSKSSTLHRHNAMHTGLKPFMCQVCNKSFVDSTTLSKHQRVHTGEKPFKCDFCRNAFNQFSHLLSHQCVHTGEKPLMCEVCDKSFVDLSTLRKHRHIHTGERKKPFKCDYCRKAFNRSSHLLSHQRIHTAEKPLPFKVNLVHNTQEVSLIGGRVPYIKELTEQEVFTRKLFGLSNPMITNGGSEMGMNEDTQVSMDTSDGDGGELAAASEIPERADEERTEVNTSQQCGMAAAVEEGEECQEVKMSDLEGSVDELKLNIVVCVKKEACDDPAAVVEGGRSEPSGSEEPLALGAESPPSPRAHGQHKAHVPGEETEDYLKPLERLHQEQVQSTDSYRVTSNLFQQTLTEFKTDIRQNLQRNKEILQQQNEVLRQQNEIRNQHLQRNNEILQQQNEVLRQQNEALCQLLQRSNETLNEMSKILSRTVVPAPSGQTQPSAETSAAGHPSGTGEITPWGLGRHRRN